MADKSAFQTGPLVRLYVGEGDILQPLRALRARYNFHEARFHNLITAAHDRLSATSAEDKPAAHARIKRLEKARNFYGGAVLALSALIPNRYEAALTEETATA